MPSFIDPATGERISIELFVAILGASNYTYAEATLTQQLQDWIASHQRAFAFVGGVTAALVCDQFKSGVVIPCRYEPGLQRTYEELAQHYGTVIVPARPAHARDKAKVEVAVRVVERWILARLRHETFFSLAALNARIAALLADLTARPALSGQRPGALRALGPARPPAAARGACPQATGLPSATPVPS
jgi:transposase